MGACLCPVRRKIRFRYTAEPARLKMRKALCMSQRCQMPIDLGLLLQIELS